MFKLNLYLLFCFVLFVFCNLGRVTGPTEENRVKSSNPAMVTSLAPLITSTTSDKAKVATLTTMSPVRTKTSGIFEISPHYQ